MDLQYVHRIQLCKAMHPDPTPLEPLTGS